LSSLVYDKKYGENPMSYYDTYVQGYSLRELPQKIKQRNKQRKKKYKEKFI